MASLVSEGRSQPWPLRASLRPLLLTGQACWSGASQAPSVRVAPMFAALWVPEDCSGEVISSLGSLLIITNYRI